MGKKREIRKGAPKPKPKPKPLLTGEQKPAS